MVIELKRVFISDEVDPRCVEVLKENGIEVVKDTKLRTDKEKFLAEISVSGTQIKSDITVLLLSRAVYLQLEHDLEKTHVQVNGKFSSTSLLRPLRFLITVKYDGLIVRSATKVTADVINAATNLKIIGRAGTGVDNIDCDAATKSGIIVMNTPGGNTLSAAEHTCALMCCLSRDIPNAVATMRAGTWDRKSFMGSELNGKTLAIIGLGRIGKEVALRMQSFGMTTIGYDPIIPGSVSAQFNTEWMELEKIWPLADYITVHTPLIPQTRNLINEAVFAKCKKGVKVVNCARGGIIDEAALLKALDAGQCGGAGLDVYVNEPPDDYTLAKHPKVIPTPHLGASTVEAQKRVAVEIAEQFVDVMHGRSLFGAINAQAMHNALSADTQPWVDLGRSLGSILGRLGVDPKKGVTITSCGTCLKDAGSYLGASVLSGLLAVEGGAGDAALNLVSAPAVAKQQGIQVESKFEMNKEAQYTQMVSVSADGRTVIGTTSGGEALLISINGAQFSTPAVLSGSAILFQAKSDPKLLACVAGSLSSNGAIVTGFSVTVDCNGSQWGVVYLPTPPPNGLFNISKIVQSAFELEF